MVAHRLPLAPSIADVHAPVAFRPAGPVHLEPCLCCLRVPTTLDVAPAVGWRSVGVWLTLPGAPYAVQANVTATKAVAFPGALFPAYSDPSIGTTVDLIDLQAVLVRRIDWVLVRFHAGSEEHRPEQQREDRKTAPCGRSPARACRSGRAAAGRSGKKGEELTGAPGEGRPGQAGRPPAGPLGRWAAGPLGRWAAGPLGRWAAGPLGKIVASERRAHVKAFLVETASHGGWLRRRALHHGFSFAQGYGTAACGTV